MPVPGWVRLLFELGVFAGSVLLLRPVAPTVAIVLGIAVGIHYALSLDRIRWLLAH